MDHLPRGFLGVIIICESEPFHSLLRHQIILHTTLQVILRDVPATHIVILVPSQALHVRIMDLSAFVEVVYGKRTFIRRFGSYTDRFVLGRK